MPLRGHSIKRRRLGSVFTLLLYISPLGCSSYEGCLKSNDNNDPGGNVLRRLAILHTIVYPIFSAIYNDQFQVDQYSEWTNYHQEARRMSVLITMLRHFKKKRPHKNINEILMHHDNSWFHVAHTVVDFLNFRGIAIIPHPPYSPDLPSCDFPDVKFLLRARNTNDEVVKAVASRCKKFQKYGLAFVSKKW